jgi:hypothetical protein
MKRSNTPRTYPSVQQREARFLWLALAVGILAAAVVALTIYFANHANHA